MKHADRRVRIIDRFLRRSGDDRTRSDRRTRWRINCARKTTSGKYIIHRQIWVCQFVWVCFSFETPRRAGEPCGWVGSSKCSGLLWNSWFNRLLICLRRSMTIPNTVDRLWRSLDDFEIPCPGQLCQTVVIEPCLHACAFNVKGTLIKLCSVIWNYIQIVVTNERRFLKFGQQHRNRDWTRVVALYAWATWLVVKGIESSMKKTIQWCQFVCERFRHLGFTYYNKN